MTNWTLDEEYASRGGTVRYAVLRHVIPFVLVHGTPFSSCVWREVALVLARDHTAYVFDLLGYGSSEKREGQDVSLAAEAKLLARLLDHWDIECEHRRPRLRWQIERAAYSALVLASTVNP